MTGILPPGPTPGTEFRTKFPLSPALGGGPFEHIGWYRGVDIVPPGGLRPMRHPMYHVGNLDSAEHPRNQPTTEGCGLGFTNDPDCMAKLVSRAPYPRACLTHMNASPRIVAMHSLSAQRVDELSAIAVAEGLIIRVPAIQISATLEEPTGYAAWALVGTQADARACAADFDRCHVRWATTPVDGFAAGRRFQAIWRRTFSSAPQLTLVRQFALLLLMELSGEADGVWWDDVHWPERDSIGRGLLFQSRLRHWNIHMLSAPEALPRSVPSDTDSSWGGACSASRCARD